MYSHPQRNRLQPVLAAALALPLAGIAQERNAEPAALDEVVVTARKREESLQDIPLVVNAITAEQIERSTIQGLGDIALRTPGLNYEGYVSSGLSGGLVLRGLTNTQLTNRTQNVAVFYDGVYLPNQAMFDLGLADIERVEILKGPQSALYGRNAFAGAVNYISRKPSSEWRGDATVTVGSDERRDYSAFVSGPLAGENVLVKLSYGRSEFDGTIRNNHPGAGAGVSPGNKGNVGGYDNESYSAGLTLRPSETLEINLGYFDTELLREPAASWSLQGAASNLFGLTVFNDLNCLPRTVFGAPRNSIRELIDLTLFSPTALPFLIVGTALGAVLAALVFAISAISIPMLLDKRDCTVWVAIATSWVAVRANWKPMALWAVLIVAFTGFGMIPFFLGLAITMPLIGHATWHAYKDLVVD